MVVPVCFHIPQNLIQRIFSRGRVTNRQLQAQIDHLNRAFTSESCCNPSADWCSSQCSVGSSIRFQFAKVNIWGELTGKMTNDLSDSWVRISRLRFRFRWIDVNIFSNEERRMKERLRKGDNSVLNVYLLNTVDPFQQELYLGYLSSHGGQKRCFRPVLMVSWCVQM